jgi:hypothetical protein
MKPILLFKAAIVALLFAACSSEENVANSPDSRKIPTKANSQLGELQRKANLNLTQKFSFNAKEKAVKFETKKGVVISLNPQELRLNGQPVTGTVNVEFIEIFSVGNMVTANKTTMAYAPGSSREPAERRLNALVSGGEFFINMTNEQGVKLDDGTSITLTVPVKLTENPDNPRDPGSEGMLGWVSTGEDTNGDGAPDLEGDVT